MATQMKPNLPPGHGYRGPNIPSADVQLPAVVESEQVERENTATRGLTLNRYQGLCVAVILLVVRCEYWT